MKYTKQIILMIIVIGFLFLLLLAGMTGDPAEGQAERLEALKYVPNNLYGPGWLIYIWLLIVVCALIGIFFCFLLGPLLLFVHKKIIGRKMEYGIEKQPTNEKFNGTLKSFLPALLAINLAFMLADVTIIQDILTTSHFDQFVGMRRFFVFLCLVPIMMVISMAIFSSIWLLQDSGIVFTNKDKVKDNNTPTHVGNPGEVYKRLLKGFAGIGALIAIYTNTMEFLAYQAEDDTSYIIITTILLPTLPFLMLLLALPAMVLFNMMQKIRNKYIQKWAIIFGIRNEVEISFQKFNQS